MWRGCKWLTNLQEDKHKRERLSTYLYMWKGEIYRSTYFHMCVCTCIEKNLGKSFQPLWHRELRILEGIYKKFWSIKESIGIVLLVLVL